MQKNPETITHVEFEPQHSLQISATLQNETNFAQNPLGNFLDGSYKTIANNYCVYGLTVQNRHKKRAACPTWLSFIKKSKNIWVFPIACKRAHKIWHRINLLLVDKDYNEMQAIAADFPEPMTQFCVWHVLSYKEELMTKLFKTKEKKLIKLRAAVYLHIYREVENNWQSFLSDSKGCDETIVTLG